MVAMTVILGHFHSEETGVKELGIALLFAQVYYTLNLLKGLSWLRKREDMELSTLDAPIGAMMLDANISIVSATFSMKECLAARQLIRWGLFSQTFALAVVALVMADLSNLVPENPDPLCRCITVIWWGPFDTCHGPSVNFWLYFALRSLTWIHDLWLCCWHMGRYDAAEKASRPRFDFDTFHISKTVYDSVPATAFTKYREWLALFVGSIANLELTLGLHNLQYTDGWATWGQTAQIVVAVCSCLHWCYNFYSMFKMKNVERRQHVLEESADCSWWPKLVKDKDSPSAEYLNLLQRTYRNNPFLKLRLRSVNHARIECECMAWRDIKICYSQYHNWNRQRKEQELIVGGKTGDRQLIMGLLAEDVDVNAKDQDNRTSLYFASGQGKLEIVQLLVKEGADVDAKDNENRTALHLALEKDNREIAWLLVEKGADIHIKDNENRIALHLALEKDNREIAWLLVKKGADIDAKDNENRIALHLALEKDNKEIAYLLVEKGADIDAKDNENRTALHLALEKDNREIAWLLVKKGADVDAKDKDDRTALHLAAKQGNEAIVRLLVKRVRNINAMDNKKRTALHLAAGNGYEAIVRLLVMEQAYINVKELEKWRTPLHEAALNGHTTVMRLLRYMGADEVPDIEGRLPKQLESVVSTRPTYQSEFLGSYNGVVRTRRTHGRVDLPGLGGS
jgi:ankyrin repeat protein